MLTLHELLFLIRRHNNVVILIFIKNVAVVWGIIKGGFLAFMIIEYGGVGASLSVIRLVMSVSPRACCRKTFRNRIFEFKIGSNRVKNNK